MRSIIIESPYAGDVARNLRYLRACCYHAVTIGDVPFASHLFFTQFLDDLDPEQRKLGIEMGYHFWDQAEKVVFYIDLGMSNGMKDALARCVLDNKPYEIRRLPKETPAPQTDFVQRDNKVQDVDRAAGAGLAAVAETFAQGMTKVPSNQIG